MEAAAFVIYIYIRSSEISLWMRMFITGPGGTDVVLSWNLNLAGEWEQHSSGYRMKEPTRVNQYSTLQWK